jgi:hypothetical protein
MSSVKRLVELAAESTTKDLPIGKTGKRWKSGHRLSWRLNKPRETRHMLKENQVRYDARKAILHKTIQITKDAKQIDVFPMPRFKKEKKVLDYPTEIRKLAIYPSAIELTKDDLTNVTPEVLPLLGKKIRDLRATGESWASVTLNLLQAYTYHLAGTSLSLPSPCLFHYLPLLLFLFFLC